MYDKGHCDANDGTVDITDEGMFHIAFAAITRLQLEEERRE